MALPVQLVVLHTARRPSVISRHTPCSHPRHRNGREGTVIGVLGRAAAYGSALHDCEELGDIASVRLRLLN
jgi:hypothetical protein